MTVEALNRLPLEQARAALGRCCGAAAWVERLCRRRPFADRAALLAEAERAAAALTDADWREAFGHHPRIGDLESLRRRFAATAAWAADEQGGASVAPEETLAALAAGNREYEQRFGYIFIVCATGKSAGEMLASLRERLANEPATELAVAAGEQMKITRLRLEKLLENPK